MKDKILFWIDNEWLRFCIAKTMQDLYDCDLFAIIDIRYTSKKFFQNQQIVKFQKTWFYRDYISTMDHQINLEYLKYFEKTYKINLWEIAFAERFFYKYNPYYKFSDKEILSILERECKLFEDILNEIKPDYLIIKLTDSHQSNLMVQLCKAKGIKVLMMGPTRFAYRYDIYEDYDKTDPFLKDEKVISNKTFEELRDYLKNYQAIKDVTSLEKRTKLTPGIRIKKYIQYLLLVGNKEFQNYYANYGKTKFSIMSRLFFIRRPIRKKFVDKTFIRKIESNEPFVYYPLHADPERSVLLVAPFYTNQLELITHISRSLPVEYKLYVKEHPGMFEYAWRDISYYKKILELPNVRLVHPSVSSEDLLNKCSLAVTISGTTGLEAAFYNKPSIVFSDVSYSVLSSVYRVKNVEELPHAIRLMLNKQADLVELNKYVQLAEKSFLKIKLADLYLDFYDHFFNEFVNGFGINISEQKMNKFIENYKIPLEEITRAHIDKIMYYKQIDSKDHL